MDEDIYKSIVIKHRFESFGLFLLNWKTGFWENIKYWIGLITKQKLLFTPDKNEYKGLKVE